MLGRLARFIRDEWQIARDPIGYARRLGVTLADDCWMPGLSRMTFGTEPYLITIGEHTAIAAGVRFVTHDGGGYVLRPEFPDIEVVGRITIGDNVMIGMNTILLAPCEIGSSSVVGAGSVVKGIVPPRSVFAGVPARFVCTFEEYREQTLARAIHVDRDLSLDERRRLFVAFVDGKVDTYGRPIDAATTDSE